MSLQFSNQAAIFFTWNDWAGFSDAVIDETIHSHLKYTLFCIHSSSHSPGVYFDNV